MVMLRIDTTGRCSIGRCATGRSAAARFNESSFHVAAYAIAPKYCLVDLSTLMTTSGFYFFISCANNVKVL